MGFVARAGNCLHASAGVLPDQAYVVLGKLELARAELATVPRLCRGTECELYADLNEAIETGRVE